jgi:hypothetical protein
LGKQLKGNSTECHLIRDRKHVTKNANGLGGVGWGDIIECNTPNTLKINKNTAAPLRFHRNIFTGSFSLTVFMYASRKINVLISLSLISNYVSGSTYRDILTQLVRSLQ